MGLEFDFLEPLIVKAWRILGFQKEGMASIYAEGL
jgi:hypothetical protein